MESTIKYVVLLDVSYFAGTYKGNVILNQNTSEYTLGNIVTANFHSDGSGVSRGFEFTITPYHTGKFFIAHSIVKDDIGHF